MVAGSSHSPAVILPAMTLRDAWDRQADEWGRFVRTPDADRTNERFNLPRLLDLLPPPGRATLDLGCGEGRLGRELVRLGHRVVGVDSSPRMVELASESHEAVVADAAALPFPDGSFDLVTAFMSLMDMDDMPAALREIARVLEPDGRLVVTVVHPLNSASFPRVHGRHTLVISDYREQRRYLDTVERDGLEMTFESFHYSLEAYWGAVREAGFVVDDLRELYDDAHPTWRKVPLFLRLDARKPA
jgi:SAM-dependent methyltransferase